MRVWHTIVIAILSVVTLGVAAEVSRDIAAREDARRENPTLYGHAPRDPGPPLFELTDESRAPFLDPRRRPEIYNGRMAVWHSGVGVRGMRIEGIEYGDKLFLQIAEEDSNPLWCVDVEARSIVVGPCVARLEVVPVAEVKP